MCVCYLQKHEGKVGGEGGGVVNLQVNPRGLCSTSGLLRGGSCGMHFVLSEPRLLADGLQSIQGAFDIANLRSQSVYGLH